MLLKNILSDGWRCWRIQPVWQGGGGGWLWGGRNRGWRRYGNVFNHMWYAWSCFKIGDLIIWRWWWSSSQGQHKRRIRKKKKSAIARPTKKAGAKPRGEEGARRIRESQSRIAKVARALDQLDNPFEEMSLDQKKQLALFMYYRRLQVHCTNTRNILYFVIQFQSVCK